MNLNTFIRLIQASIVIVVITISVALLGFFHVVAGFTKPFINLSAYTVGIVSFYLITTTLYTLIVHRKCKNVEPSDLVEVNQHTVTTDSQEEVDIVEASITPPTGLASALKYMHTVTVTPNSDDPHSWMEIATIENKSQKEERSICFVVDKTRDELNGDTSFTDATSVVYPEENYTELNSTYTTLESLQFYDQTFTKIKEYTVE